MARPGRPLRFEQTNMLIICDGETEKNYFNYVIKQHLAKQKIAVKLDIHNFRTITETNNYIKRKPGTPPFDAVIFLKDLENSNLALKECENIARFEGMSGKQKNKSYWFVFYNYPSMEYWFILHFIQCRKNFNNAKEAEYELKKSFPEYVKPMPRNNQEAQLFLEKIDNAIRNFKSLKFYTTLGYSQKITKIRKLTNPMTDMPALIDVIKTSRKNFH